MTVVKTGVMEKARQPYTNTPNLLKTGFTRWLPHLMSTTKEKEIDYQAYMRENPPDLSNVIRGPEAREKRREAAMGRMLRKKQDESNTRQFAQKGADRINAATEKEIDYQAYLRDNPPDLSNVVHGPEAREKRREAAMKRILQDKQSEDHDTQ